MSGGKSVKLSEGNYATLKDLKHLYKVESVNQVVEKIISELAGQDKYDEFFRMLVDWGVNKLRARGIVKMWRHYDVTDIKKLAELMAATGIPDRIASVMMEGWLLVASADIKKRTVKAK